MKPFKELRSFDQKSLEKELRNVTAEYTQACFQNTQGNLKDTSSILKMRRYIARIKTLQSSL